MIDLTPLEVRKKKGDFRRQLRGYDPGQVDDFLDVVADRLEQLVRENMSATERLTRLEQQVTEFRDRERAMTEALVTAQQMREQMQTQVVKEVEFAKRQAVQDADRIRAEAVQEAEREEENLARLRQRQRQLLHSFRSFLERELSELVVFSKALEFDDSVPEEDAPSRIRRSPGRSRFAAGRTAPPSAAIEDEGDEAEAEEPRAAARPPEPRPYQPPAAEAPQAAAPPRPPETMSAAAAAVVPPAAAPSGLDVDAAPPAAGATTAHLDAFGDVMEEPAAASSPFMEPPPAIADRPEPGRAADQGRPDLLSDVSEAEMGGLFTDWVDEPVPPPEPAAALAEPAPAEPVSDEEFLDELLMAEAELLLSDEDVLEDPLDESAFEEVGGDPDAADFALDEELVAEEAAEAVPGDQPVDLAVLSDADEFADLNIDDLGLPPLPKTADRNVFDSSGLTLRPLPAEEEAPEVPRERRDDDEDMFSSLFGKPR